MKRTILTLIIVCCTSLNSFSKTQNKTITIIHSNDTHSQLEPTSKGKGGIVNRAILIDSIKQTDPIVFVFDSGDMVQGTPYFNLFKGDAEATLANQIGIDAGTIGNHEFDNGAEAMLQLLEKLNYPVVCSNLIVETKRTNNPIHPYTIIERNGLKIGVVGICVDPIGLISSKNFVGLKYLPPFNAVEKVAKRLKVKEKCDLVVCLSHLGFAYSHKPNKYSDVKLANDTRYIDVILGGHSHTILEKPVEIKNKKGHTVIINQAGYRGENLGIIKIKL